MTLKARFDANMEEGHKVAIQQAALEERGEALKLDLHKCIDEMKEVDAGSPEAARIQVRGDALADNLNRCTEELMKLGDQMDRLLEARRKLMEEYKKGRGNGEIIR